MAAGPEFATLVVGTFVVMATPGVTVSAVTGTTIRHGRLAGLRFEAGAMLARLMMLAALAFGLETVGRLMTEAFDLIKLVGAAYLIWLGARTMRNPPRLVDGTPPTHGRFADIGSGFVVLWTNPKAFLFAGAFLPQFVVPGEPVLPQLALVGGIWIGVVALTDGAYILLADGARRLMRGAFARRVGAVSGSILIAGGLWLALQRQP